MLAVSVSIPGSCSISANAQDVIDEEAYLAPSALQAIPIRKIEIVSPEEIVSETVAAVPAGEPQKVKVKKGDTLYSIAKAQGVKVYELAARNGLAAPFTLKPDQTLEIPPDSGALPEPARTVGIITNLDSGKTFVERPKVDSVEVRKGDTIYSIARNAGVPLKDLILRNGMRPPYAISIGQKIYMPSTAFHIVQKQDTLYSVSRKYGVNLNSLARINDIEPPFNIAIGQKLTLPAANVDTAEAPKVILEAPAARPKIVESKKPEPERSAKIVEEEIVIGETAAEKEKVARIIARPVPMSAKKFMWPVDGKVISEFGMKSGGKRNDGINISALVGTKVRSAENGIVVYAGNELKGLGNLVIIRHDQDYMTIYAHNDSLGVGRGDRVSRGDVIASAGKTGRVTTPQLHFEIRQKTKSINPTSMLERK
jgi:murein DD-endopeptidase MepM/ murein hydrolase activator NlpD